MEIPAKVWREMKTSEILASMDIALNVLEERTIDIDWLKKLLDIGLRCIQKVNEEW